MTIIKTDVLTGAALDWAVAKCQGYVVADVRSFLGEQWAGGKRWHDSWAKAGPIVEREGIATRRHSNGTWYAMAQADVGDGERSAWCEFTYRGGERYGKYSYEVRPRRMRFVGTTMLEAAMRCYVASKLGASVDIPDCLTTDAPA